MSEEKTRNMWRLETMKTLKVESPLSWNKSLFCPVSNKSYSLLGNCSSIALNTDGGISVPNFQGLKQPDDLGSIHLTVQTCVSVS